MVIVEVSEVVVAAVSEETEEATEETEEVTEEEEAPVLVMRIKPGRKELSPGSRELENNFDFSFLIRLL